MGLFWAERPSEHCGGRGVGLSAALPAALIGCSSCFYREGGELRPKIQDRMSCWLLNVPKLVRDVSEKMLNCVTRGRKEVVQQIGYDHIPSTVQGTLPGHGNALMDAIVELHGY